MNINEHYRWFIQIYQRPLATTWERDHTGKLVRVAGKRLFGYKTNKIPRNFADFKHHPHRAAIATRLEQPPVPQAGFAEVPKFVPGNIVRII